MNRGRDTRVFGSALGIERADWRYLRDQLVEGVVEAPILGTRLGFFRPRASFEEAHDEMLRLVRGSDPYEAHTALLRHGRRTCVARAPRCGECPLRRICPYARKQGRA